jgi:hypothetical protein
MILNIVEPTLNDYTGHCYSLVEAIAQAAPTGQVQIWAGVQSGKIWSAKGEVKPYFFRPLRKIQSFFLYRHLLKQPGKLLLSTAGTTDVMLLDWAAHGKIPENKVYLYVHWLGSKASKAQKLAKLARSQPNLEMLCTTATTTAFFRNLGFRARTVAYPRVQDDPKVQPSQAFEHLLFAGAARMDKGFDRIADLVEDLARMKEPWPMRIQISATHQARHDAEILFQIERLRRSAYFGLTLIGTTLAPSDYQALFSGGISIQPYAKADFADRVSGVTLDALTAGCPVVVTADTWLGRVVLKHNAGVATSDLSPNGLRMAVNVILRDYAGYSRRAANAALALRQEHSATAMMSAIFQDERSSGV